MRRIQVMLGLMGGLLVLLALALTPLPRGVRAADNQPGLMSRFVSVGQPGPLAPAQTISCTVSFTTTSDVPNIYTAYSAAPIANYNNLALVQSPTYPVSGTAVIVPVVDNWFVIGNTISTYLYTVDAEPNFTGNYNLGMEIYSGSPGSLTLFHSDVNTGDGNGATIDNITFPTAGPYYVRIFQISSFCSGLTYKLTFTSIGPTNTPSLTPKPTKTTGPTATPFSGQGGVDKFEPDDNFDEAATVGLNVKYTGLNFVQWQYDPDSWDNDFFRVRVKPGMLVTCRTLDLAPGTDTNLILYDNNRNGINGNDDVNRAAGDLSSSVTYYVTYEGWLYALVGEGFPRPLSEQATTGYSFECSIASQLTPTPAPTPTEIPGQPTRTPIPTETPIPSPTLTPTPPFVVVKPLATATPPGLPTLQIPVSLLAYYDANGNNKYDPGEGIVGMSARVIDLTTGNLLAQGFTDETGRASFVVSAPGAVQLTVPYLNYSAIILPAGGVATLRVSARELPNAIP